MGMVPVTAVPLYGRVYVQYVNGPPSPLKASVLTPFFSPSLLCKEGERE